MSQNQRVVIVTGGSRGLGAGIVEAFLAAGDIVAACARSGTEQTTHWAQTYGEERFLFQELDLVDRDATRDFVKQIIARWGRIDVLINNAGVARDGVLAMSRPEDVDVVVDLNLKATLNLSQLVVRRMLSAGSGNIINISSIVGRSGYRGLSVYSATKAALDGLTRSMARELGSRGIIVNGIAPGYLRTEMSHGLDEEQLQQIVRRTPSGRLGEPADVARAALFLAAPENDYITGQILVIDGGLTC